jgi:4-alpha-glucanotransferase
MTMANADNSTAIVKRYQDAFGNWREASDETCAAILAAMGQTPEEEGAPVWVLRRGERRHLSGPAEITLEDSTALQVESELPEDLPLGYHTLRYLDSEREIKLIVSPGVCYLPEHLRIWGWSAQLYALRGRRSSMRFDPMEAGGSAISPICVSWAAGRHGSLMPGCF